MNTLFFVVPVYNVEQYLPRCIDSLLCQTYPKIKIILVNDGAKDQSGKICDSYAQKHPNITVIHKENGGLSSARNTGLDACFSQCSKNDWLAFIDSDDFIHPAFSTRMIALAEQNQCDIVQCGYEKGAKNTFSLMPPKKKLTVSNGADALLGYRLKSQLIPKLYRLSLFEKERLHLGVLNEDEYIGYRIYYTANRIAITDEPLYYYFQREGSIMETIANHIKNNSHNEDWYHAYLERIAFFKEKGEKEQVLRTYEKICTDIILRQSEQQALPKEKRDDFAVNGTYTKRYCTYYKKMRKRKGISFKKRLMYFAFRLLPYSAYIASRFTALRK